MKIIKVKEEPIHQKEISKFENFIFNIEVGSLVLAFISFFIFLFFFKNRYLLSFTTLMGIIYFVFGFYENEKEGFTRNHFNVFYYVGYFEHKKNSAMFVKSQLLAIAVIFALLYVLILLLTNENALELLNFRTNT